MTDLNNLQTIGVYVVDIDPITLPDVTGGVFYETKMLKRQHFIDAFNLWQEDFLNDPAKFHGPDYQYEYGSYGEFAFDALIKYLNKLQGEKQ